MNEIDKNDKSLNSFIVNDYSFWLLMIPSVNLEDLVCLLLSGNSSISSFLPQFRGNAIGSNVL